MKKNKLTKEKRAIICLVPALLITGIIIVLDISRAFDGVCGDYGYIGLYLPLGIFLLESAWYAIWKQAVYKRTTNYWRNTLRRLTFAWICFAVSMVTKILYSMLDALISVGINAVPQAFQIACLDIRWLSTYLLLVFPFVVLNFYMVNHPGIVLEVDGKEEAVLEEYLAEDTYYLLSDLKKPLEMGFYKVKDDKIQLASESEARELYTLGKRQIYRRILKHLKTNNFAEHVVLRHYEGYWKDER